MDRNTVTNVSALRHGDVFYRIADKKKATWVLLVLPVKQRSGKVQDTRMCMDTDTYAWLTKSGMPVNDKLARFIRDDYRVVFLRHTVDSDISQTKLPNEV